MEQVDGKTSKCNANDESNGTEVAHGQTAIKTPVIQTASSSSAAAVSVVKPPKPEGKNGKELQAAAAAAAASVVDDDDDEDGAGGAAKSSSGDDAMPPSKRLKKSESEETSTTSEEGVATTSTGPARRLRKFQRIPMFIVDYHNDVLEFIYRCLATRHLPMENNVLIHFDSHPDMVISREIPASASYDKETMLAELSIENWIMPTVFAGHINRVVWLKNDWCQQIPTGKYRFKVGSKDDKINVDIPLDYFISEGNYCDSAELKDARDVELHVINADRASEVAVEQLLSKDDGPNFILDIDLDFFSTSNPFLEIYKDAQCYRRLTEIFRYDNVSPLKCDTEVGSKVDIENGSKDNKEDTENGSKDNKEATENGSKDQKEETENGSKDKKEDTENGSKGNKKDFENGSKDKAEPTKEDPTESAGISKSSDGFVINAGLNSQVYSGNTKRRKQQLEALKSIFEHLEEVRSFQGLAEPDPEIVTPETFDKIKELLTVLQRHYSDEEIDWLLIYDSGSTTDSMGLPHHISTPDELEVYLNNFRQFLKRLPAEPAIITIACSAEDDYCPKDQVALIQEEVLAILEEVYGERLNPKPILQYLEDEWDVMNL